MAELKKYYPKHFEIEAVTIDLGLPGMDFSGVEEFCRSWMCPIRW